MTATTTESGIATSMVARKCEFPFMLFLLLLWSWLSSCPCCICFFLLVCPFCLCAVAFAINRPVFLPLVYFMFYGFIPCVQAMLSVMGEKSRVMLLPLIVGHVSYGVHVSVRRAMYCKS